MFDGFFTNLQMRFKPVSESLFRLDETSSSLSSLEFFRKNTIFAKHFVLENFIESTQLFRCSRIIGL